MRNNSLLFIHVPKTAGTSFRQAAEDYFGKENTLSDYGVKSEYTSPLIKQWIYEKKDYFRFLKELRQKKNLLLGGHVPFKKYSPLFPANKIISFVRNPIQRLISHYEHSIRLHDYKGSFSNFLNVPGAKSARASHLLAGVPIEALGVIGVTERFEDSLYVLNQTYGTGLEILTMNNNQDKQFPTYPISKNHSNELRLFLEKEDILYQRVNELLDARLTALKNNYVYVHGTIETLSKKKLSGFAFIADKAASVKVQLQVNDRPQGVTLASSFRSHLHAAGVQRGGYVGFDFSFRRCLNHGDKIVCIVPRTGQILGERTFSP